MCVQTYACFVSVSVCVCMNEPISYLSTLYDTYMYTDIIQHNSRV